MTHAKDVKAEYKELERGFRKGIYKVRGRALSSYRIFLTDETAQDALFHQDNIARLREQPALEETSRMLLYYLTDARSEPERNISGKYACVVDFLHEQGVENDDAAKYIEEAGGIEELLKRARKRDALKAGDETRQADDRGSDQEEESDNADDSASGDATDDLFDPARDLSIRVGSEKRALVLSSNIDISESFYLECKKTGPWGRDGILIVGRLVDLEPK
jgi:hypothetical protein